MQAGHNGSEDRLRLLAVCGDDEQFGTALAKLRADGFDVKWEPSIYRAVAEFAQQPAHVVVIELEGLESDQLECIRVLRELNESAYVLTVFSMENRRQAGKALSEGADAYLLQPFYSDELAALVRRGVRRLSQRQDAKHDYERHLESLARLAKGTAHQINNPLTTLSGWLQMMKSEHCRRPEERQRLSSMQEEVDRIADVVEGLQSFGQEQPPQCHPVDLNGLLSTVMNEIRSEDEGIRIETDLARGDIVVWGDEKLLEEACRLLLHEACRAARKSGVSVTTRGGDGTVEMAVTEKGGQISESQMERLFEPYGYSSGNNGRSGLAYPAAYGIIRSHGGELTVNNGEGQGTTIKITLPQSSQVPEGG